MPYEKITDHPECGSGEIAVVKETTGEVMGCHGSESEANDQIAALNASEEGRSMDVLPREDLVRGITPIESRDKGNVMVGYPIVFNEWTEIDSWEGHFLERIAPGAAERSIQHSRADDGSYRIRVQYNHGMHPVVGTSGLGRPKRIKADDSGYFAEVPLSDTSYNRDIIKPQLKDGTLDGMSFRFSVQREDVVNTPEQSDHNPHGIPERTVQEIKLHEFGPVDWPAYEATQVGIRSAVALAAWQRMPENERRDLMRQFGMAADLSQSADPVPSRDDFTDYAERNPGCEIPRCDQPTHAVARNGKTLRALCARHHRAKEALTQRAR